MKNLFVVLMMMIVSNVVFSHGENKLGPHNGYVRMPGAFHTEVVPAGKDQIKVYLLDIDWKNPSVVKSEVKASIVSKTNEDATCIIQENYFLCQFSKKVSLNKKSRTANFSDTRRPSRRCRKI